MEANATYTTWLLEAITKIKQQKQRPNEERICNVVQTNHKVTKDAILEQLALAVKDGSILKVQNKGMVSYKDPSTVCQLRTRCLEITPQTDLTKVLVRSVRELGESKGSTLRSIEKYIKNSYRLRLQDGANLGHLLKMQLKQVLRTGQIQQEGIHLKLSPAPNVNNISNRLSAETNFNIEDLNPNDIILPFERHRVS